MRLEAPAGRQVHLKGWGGVWGSISINASRDFEIGRAADLGDRVDEALLPDERVDIGPPVRLPGHTGADLFLLGNGQPFG